MNILSYGIHFYTKFPLWGWSRRTALFPYTQLCACCVSCPAPPPAFCLPLDEGTKSVENNTYGSSLRHHLQIVQGRSENDQEVTKN